MQIRATVLRRQRGYILAMVKALYRGFGNSSKIRRLADPVPLTLDLLNPKSIGFDILSSTTTVPNFKSFGSEVFVFSC